MVARLGVGPERIVLANACKRPRDIRHAAAKQVLQCNPAPVLLLLSAASGCLTAHRL
jgi:diaminopimelate decarboxylase